MPQLSISTLVYGKNSSEEYEVVRQVGQGSFGTVYAVERRATGETLALKTLGDTGFLNPTELRALRNEGQLALAIDHPNVVRIHFFHTGEQYPSLPPYTLMEYVGGGNLQQLITSRGGRRQFSVSEMLGIFIQLATGMQAINARLVHRDIKPDNILIDNGVYKIADFGLSKIVGAATRARSQTLKGINHIMYSAPEAIRFEENLPLMDMYSMGVVFFQIATQKLPYVVQSSGDLVEAWRQAHLFQQPLDPSTLNHELPVELSQMILKMIAKRPSDRYRSWDEILQRLQHVGGGTTQTQDITGLLRRDLDSRRKAERVELEAQSRLRAQEEEEGFLKYSFNQVLQAASAIVDDFNRSSDATRLRVYARSQFAFSIRKEGQEKGPEVKVDVEVPRNTSQFRVAQLSVPSIKAWGTVQAPSGYGFNLVLVSTGQDDLYGEWRVFWKNKSFPNFDFQRPKTQPYDMAELPTHSSYFASGISHGSDAEFSAETLLPLIEEIL